MNDPNDSLLYLQIAVALASTGCCAALVRKAASFHAKLWLGALVFLISTAIFTLLSVHIPLFFLSGSDRVQYQLSIDIMMFGTAGLVLMAIIGFAVDHMSERPSWLMLAAAACMAIGLFPFWYQFNQDTLNERYQIKIVEPEKQKSTLESILRQTPTPDTGSANTTGEADTEPNTSEGSKSN